MGCEAPRDEIEQIICQVVDEEASGSRGVIEETQNQLQEEREAGEKIRTTLRLIGAEERNFLHSYFQIPYNVVQAVARIEEIQRQLGFVGDDIDGIVGPGTLRRIYEQEYSRNFSRIGELQQTRWEIYTEMKDYPPKRRWVRHLGETVTLHPSSTPNVFSKNYYLGETPGEPLDGTGINSDILTHLNRRIERQDTVAYMLEINNKYVIAAYINGQLAFASYTSPGNPNHRDGQGIATPEGNWEANREEQYADRYWISGARASVRRSGGKYVSDIMPYAINTEGGIFSHAGATNGERRSHGCMRLPLHYAQALYEIFEASGKNMAWDIQTS